MVGLSACSGAAGGGTTVPQTAAQAAPPTSVKHRNGTSLLGITGTVSFAVPAAVNAPLQMTIALSNGSPSVNEYQVNLSDALPTSGIQGQLAIASTQYTNTCGGTVNGTTGPQLGDTSIKLVGGWVNQSSNCAIVVSVVASVAGSYVDGGSTISTSISGGKPVWADNTGAIVYSSASENLGFAWNPATLNLPAPSNGHLYVALPSSSLNAGEIVVYQNVTGTVQPLCYVTSSSFQNPQLVATNTLNGDLYVYDESGQFSVLEGNICDGGVVNVNPPISYHLANPVSGMIVDPAGRIAFADGSFATFANPRSQSAPVFTMQASNGDSWTQAAADVANVYLYDSNNFTITTFQDTAQNLAGSISASNGGNLCRFLVNAVGGDTYETENTPYVESFVMAVAANGGQVQPSGADAQTFVWLGTSYPAKYDPGTIEFDPKTGLNKMVGVAGAYGAVMGVATCTNNDWVSGFQQGPSSKGSPSGPTLQFGPTTLFGEASDSSNNRFAVSTWPEYDEGSIKTGPGPQLPMIETYSYTAMYSTSVAQVGQVPYISLFEGMPKGAKPSSFAFGW